MPLVTVDLRVSTRLSCDFAPTHLLPVTALRGLRTPHRSLAPGLLVRHRQASRCEALVDGARRRLLGREEPVRRRWCIDVPRRALHPVTYIALSSSSAATASSSWLPAPNGLHSHDAIKRLPIVGRPCQVFVIYHFVLADLAHPMD